MVFKSVNTYKNLLITAIFLCPLIAICQGQQDADYYEKAKNEVQQNTNYEKALKLGLKAQKEAPERIEIEEFLGVCYAKLNQPEKAKTSFLKVLNKEPKRTKAKEYLVELEIAEKNYSDALKHVKEILETNPKSKKLWLMKIKLDRKLNKLDQAENTASKLYHIFPEDEEVKYTYKLIVSEQALRFNE